MVRESAMKRVEIGKEKYGKREQLPDGSAFMLEKSARRGLKRDGLNEIPQR